MNGVGVKTKTRNGNNTKKKPSLAELPKAQIRSVLSFGGRCVAGSPGLQGEGALAFCLVSPCCLCPPDSAARNRTKRKQPAAGQRSGAVAKRREVKRSRTGRTQALNSEWRRQSVGFSRFRRNQRRSPVQKIAVCRRSIGLFQFRRRNRALIMAKLFFEIYARHNRNALAMTMSVALCPRESPSKVCHVPLPRVREKSLSRQVQSRCWFESFGRCDGQAELLLPLCSNHPSSRRCPPFQWPTESPCNAAIRALVMARQESYGMAQATYTTAQSAHSNSACWRTVLIASSCKSGR